MGEQCENCGHSISSLTPLLHIAGNTLELCIDCFIKALELLESEPEATETVVTNVSAE